MRKRVLGRSDKRELEKEQEMGQKWVVGGVGAVIARGDRREWEYILKILRKDNFLSSRNLIYYEDSVFLSLF